MFNHFYLEKYIHCHHLLLSFFFFWNIHFVRIFRVMKQFEFAAANYYHFTRKILIIVHTSWEYSLYLRIYTNFVFPKGRCRLSFEPPYLSTLVSLLAENMCPHIHTHTKLEIPANHNYQPRILC